MKLAPVEQRLFLVMMALNKTNPEFFRGESIDGRELISIRATTEYDNSQKVLELDICKGKNPQSTTVSFRVKNPQSNMCYDSGWTSDLNEELMIRVKNCFKRALTNHIDNF